MRKKRQQKEKGNLIHPVREPPGEARGSLPTGAEARTAADMPNSSGEVDDGPTMEEVIERQNMKAAYKRVVSNKGSAGPDGMTVGELAEHLKQHWPRIRATSTEQRIRATST